MPNIFNRFFSMICPLNQKRPATTYTIKEHIQATPVLYKIEKRLYLQLPVSRAMAVKDAIHGKYNKTKTIKARADAGEKGVFPLTGEGVEILWESASASS